MYPVTHYNHIVPQYPVPHHSGVYLYSERTQDSAPQFHYLSPSLPPSPMPPSPPLYPVQPLHHLIPPPQVMYPLPHPIVVMPNIEHGFTPPKSYFFPQGYPGASIEIEPSYFGGRKLRGSFRSNCSYAKY